MLLEIKDLIVSYDTEDGIVRAVNKISFSVNKGKTLGIVGETGAGKTTAAKSILRLLPERTGNIRNGEIYFNGDNVLTLSEHEIMAIRGEKISMIFQDPMSSLNPVLTVGEQIGEVLFLHSNIEKRKGSKKPAGELKEEIEKRVDEILELVGIPASRKKDYPHQFSGGMKQRVIIAMALVCSPELVIADEPTTALDVTIQAQVLEIMENLKKQFNTAMIMITHDLGIVAQVCDDVAVMYAGEIVEQGTVEDIFDKSKKHHPYTLGLFDSIPKIHDDAPRLKPIFGLMPDPVNLPEGCKFSPRCSYCTEECKSGEIDYVINDGHRIKCINLDGEETILMENEEVAYDV